MGLAIFTILALFFFLTPAIIVTKRLPFLESLKETGRFWKNQYWAIVIYLLITFAITLAVLIITNLMLNPPWAALYFNSFLSFLLQFILPILFHYVFSVWSIIVMIAAMKFYVHYSVQRAHVE